MKKSRRISSCVHSLKGGEIKDTGSGLQSFGGKPSRKHSRPSRKKGAPFSQPLFDGLLGGVLGPLQTRKVNGSNISTKKSTSNRIYGCFRAVEETFHQPILARQKIEKDHFVMSVL